MKRITLVAALLMLAAFALPVIAHDEHHMPGQKVVTKDVTGEVVDMGCYLGHGARGADHVSCASKCLAQGMPMGLLTSNGTLYLVTLDHDNADPYNRLKDMAGKTVTVNGELLSRDGMKAIEASSVQLAGR
jgi:hypothetical protein